ncbi:uncharacterized protein LOC117171543 [Belonocnema kinseyi]|uniref:uncharacterized protein LOC117171543 n=1 Tax=Belonocnema kinseyi TaxID=2817044 RepID=UPI00143DD702|nr:uncharacterized protein LOC117171543 [Belonocnema kinseyi]
MVLTEKVFRGRKATNLVQLDSSSYKTDYLLIPKEEEERFCKSYTPPTQRILPRTMEFPPLLKEILMRQMKADGKPVTEPRLSVKYNLTNNLQLSRIAKKGETPDFEIKIGLGTPASPNLYKNIKQ